MTDHFTDEEVEALKAGLDAATPGPWVAQSRDDEGEDRGMCAVVGVYSQGLIGAALPWPTELDEGDFSRVQANAAHIARCSPDAIRRLLARLEQAEVRVKELEAELSLIYASEGAAPGPSGPSFTGTVAAGEPLSTGFERAEIHGEAVAWQERCILWNVEDESWTHWEDDWTTIPPDAPRPETSPNGYQQFQYRPLYAHPDPAVERLQRELDEARGIVRAIHWMACRYADGRNTYAPEMYNRAIRKAYDAGWLTFTQHAREPDVQYARDGMDDAARAILGDQPT